MPRLCRRHSAALPHEGPCARAARHQARRGVFFFLRRLSLLRSYAFPRPLPLPTLPVGAARGWLAYMYALPRPRPLPTAGTPPKGCCCVDCLCCMAPENPALPPALPALPL